MFSATTRAAAGPTEIFHSAVTVTVTVSVSVSVPVSATVTVTVTVTVSAPVSVICEPDFSYKLKSRAYFALKIGV
jgi:hypothetical protein